MVSLEQVIEVLKVFYAAREQQDIVRANEWLLQFQKSVDASDDIQCPSS